MMKINPRFCKYFVLGFAIGVTLSLMSQSSRRCSTVYTSVSVSSTHNLQSKYNESERQADWNRNFQEIIIKSSQNSDNFLTPSARTEKLILIGVMTAHKYLGTRATAVYNTWGRRFAGKILFFAGGGNGSIRTRNDEEVAEDATLPIIYLPGVDDSYPPQRKSFMMLAYMLENYGDEYEWFLRADDDVYIHTQKLEDFLRSVNSNHLHFIGQTGRGSRTERGKLNLGHDENFCMGGPGIIFSKATLKKVAPHVSECLEDMMYSTHEDVEVGRCVHRFAGISCTWAYEMQSIFYHNSSGDQAFVDELKRREVHRAITLHPVKHPDHLYRLHSYFQGREIEKRFYETILLQRDLLFTETELGGQVECEDKDLTTAFDGYNFTGQPPSLKKFSPINRSEIPEWTFIGKSGLNSPHSMNPSQKIDAAGKEALHDVARELMEMINSLSKVRGRVIEFKELLYGYHRVDPLHGEDFVLDILMTYKKYRGKKMTVPVRRHAYIQRPFGPLQLRFVNTPKVEDLSKLVFIVPLSGRFPAFQRFLANYQLVCSNLSAETSNGKLRLELIVVHFGNNSENDQLMSLLITARQNHLHPSCIVTVTQLQGEFSRGIGLQTGISQCEEDDLLFLVDVDVVFSPEAIRRILYNTIQGVQVYFPILFSEYSNEFFGAEQKESENFQISTDSGYWREFGFGIAAFYKSDFMKVSGFDVSIQGWGKEDVALFDEFLIQTNLTVFRSPDPELLHMYHPVHCASNLSPAQYEMCIGSQASNLGSTSNLLNYIFKNPLKSKTLTEISKFLLFSTED